MVAKCRSTATPGKSRNRDRSLEASGCAITTQKRRDLLQATLNGFGVRLRDEAIEAHATSESFPRVKHNMVQSMLAVNDLFYLAQPIVESLFLEDVEKWLTANGIRFTPKAKFSGLTGYDHLFHFVIPSTPAANRPERIVRAINRPSKDTAQSFIHDWTDTQKTRSAGSMAFAMLNDLEPVPSAVTEALRNYQITPVAWSQRAGVVRDLAA